MQGESIVSRWLSGADDAGGFGNPAGPLYIHGEAATKAAMTDASAAENAASSTLLTCVRPTACC